MIQNQLNQAKSQLSSNNNIINQLNQQIEDIHNEKDEMESSYQE